MTKQEIKEKIEICKDELFKLEEELRLIELSNINLEEYKKYTGKWVKHYAYESGVDYIFVKDVDHDETGGLMFIGYGIKYNGNLNITEADDEEVFNISRPDMLTILDDKTDVVQDFFRFYKRRFRDNVVNL